MSAPRTGHAQAQIRYTNGAAVTRMLTMTVNGTDATVVAFPPTGGWDVTNTVPVTVMLREGAGNQLSFANATGGGADIDAVAVGAPITLNAAALTGGPVTGPGGLCVDVAGANRANGTAVQLYTCNGNGAQQWTLQSNGAVEALGKCLDVPAGQTGNGTRVWLWDCNGLPWQQWTVRGDGELQTSAGSGRCLETPGTATAPGTAVQVWDCVGSPWTNQKWWARGDGSIVNLRSNLCLDTQNGATANGTRLVVNPCDGRPSQRWRPPAR
ncbi:ricin-type beta-trefoil lectin domain protein [Dactylosporangium sp. NPDC049742]|uniref:ricin-type beta-trefoil lectin domain protein n=1 Tax=Dactylosporangium sp. NPDC049742 TaxID=3154737 RepID=UPI00341E4987